MKILASWLAGLVLATLAPVAAAAGEPDLGFARLGWFHFQLETLPNTLDYGGPVALDSQGRLLAFVKSAGVGYLERRLANGALDSAYGHDGRVRIDFDADRMAIVTADTAKDDLFLLSYRCELLRVDGEGGRVAAFGDDGVADLQLGSPFNQRACHHLSLDGEQPIVAGNTVHQGYNRWLVARLDAAGRPLAGFGTDGKAYLTWGLGGGAATAVLPGPGNTLYVAGAVSNWVLLARIGAATGALDTTFGNAGAWNHNPMSSSFTGAPIGLAATPTGPVVITSAGRESYDAGPRVEVLRISHAGALLEWNRMTLPGPRHSLFASSLAMAPGADKFWLATRLYDYETYDTRLALVRFDAASGTFDESFGSGGALLTDLHSYLAYAASPPAGGLVAQHDRLIVGGAYDVHADTASSDAYLASFSTADGTRLPLDGKPLLRSDALRPASAVAQFVFALPEGYWLAGASALGRNYTQRLDAAGQLEPTYGDAGTATLPLSLEGELRFAADATRMVVAGAVLAPAAAPAKGGSSPVYDVGMRQIDPQGALDPAFGSQGEVRLATGQASLAARALALDDGTTVVLVMESGGTERAGGLFRLLPDGSPDPSFGLDGYARVLLEPHASLDEVVVLPAGYFVTGRDACFDSSDCLMSFLLIDRAGQPVPSFGLNGRRTLFLDAGATVRAAWNGKHLVAASYWHPWVTAARLLPDLSLDRDFAARGRLHYEAPGLAAPVDIAFDGERIVVGLATRSEAYVKPDFALLRLDRRGRPDPSFGPAGLRTFDGFHHSYDTLTSLLADGRGYVAAGASSDVASVLRLANDEDLQLFSTGFE